MKRVPALGWVVACFAAVAAVATRPGPGPASVVPPPGRISADFHPEFATMEISWKEPAIASADVPGPYGYRYRYRRESGRWSGWRSTGFPGVDLHGSHDRERIEIAVRTRLATGKLSAATRARVAGTTPPTYDCKPHPRGAYPTKCVANTTPPMGG